MNAYDRLEELFRKFSMLERDAELRQFACWVAAQTNPTLQSHKNILTTIAHELDSREHLSRACYQTREEFKGTAIAAGTVGMRHAPQSAASFLACFACADEDTFHAARKAVKFACVWYKEAIDSEDDEVFVEHLADKLEAMWNRLNGERSSDME